MGCSKMAECETVNRWMIDVGLQKAGCIDPRVTCNINDSYVHLSPVAREQGNYGAGDRVLELFLGGLSENEISEYTLLSAAYVRTILIRAGLIPKAKMLGGENKKRAVIQMTMSGIFIKEHGSIKEASLEIGVSKTSIMLACQGKRNKAVGFKWEYKNQ